MHSIIPITAGILGVPAILFGIFLSSYFSSSTSKAHTFKSAFYHYVILKSMQIIGSVCNKKFIEETKQCDQISSEFLMNLLEMNRDTVYGKDLNFREIKDAKDFVKRHPITNYDHYKNYIEKIAKGEKNVMFTDPVVRLGVTSGTSGSTKMIPISKKQNVKIFTRGVSLAYHTIFGSIPNAHNLQKSMKLMYMPNWRFSEGNIQIGPNSSNPSDSKALLNVYSSPKEVYHLMDERVALYLHILFGLKDKLLGTIAYLIHNMFLVLIKKKELLIQDIQNGTISLDIDQDLKNSLTKKFLKPDAIRAKEIEECFKGGIDGIATRLWPKLYLILTCDTGTFSMYSEKIRRFIGNSIPIYSPLYAATEGLIGVNLNVNSKTYTLVPSAMFFEFLPVTTELGNENNENQNNENPLFMSEVEIGKSYELIITNLSGLYRYRLGDVIKVVDKCNSSLQIEFMYRIGQLLNVRGEKTSEKMLYDAIQTVFSPDYKGLKMMDYSSVESYDDDAFPCYNIIIEFEECDTSVLKQKDLSELADLLDDKLKELSWVYLSFRNKNSIKRLGISVVQMGTFQKLREKLIYSNENEATNPNQAKIPRVLRKDSLIEFVLSNAIISSLKN